MQEVVRLSFPSSSVESIRLGQEGRIGNWRWRRAGNDIKLRVRREQESKQGEGLLVRQMTEHTGEESLTLRSVQE